MWPSLPRDEGSLSVSTSLDHYVDIIDKAIERVLIDKAIEGDLIIVTDLITVTSSATGLPARPPRAPGISGSLDTAPGYRAQ